MLEEKREDMTIRVSHLKNYMEPFKQFIEKLSDEEIEFLYPKWAAISFEIAEARSLASLHIYYEKYIATIRFYDFSYLGGCYAHSHEAMIGLIAHEIAHYYLWLKENPGFRDDTLANKTACKWGFTKDIEKLKSEAKIIEDYEDKITRQNELELLKKPKHK